MCHLSPVTCNFFFYPTKKFDKVLELVGGHLCFEQAQPKMYHSPKVDDGVDVFFKIS